MSELKIVSLLPAATEIVCSLGKQHLLVGRSHECDFPEDVKSLPVCSSARFISGDDSGKIDQQIKDLLADALSIYTIDADMIRSLNPDVIITQTQCEVCAVSLTEVENALAGLLDKNCRIISLEPHVLDDVFNDIDQIAEAINAVPVARKISEESNERLDIIRHKLKFMADKPGVACIEWLAPLMVAGNWTPELVEIAGGRPLLANNGKHSPFVDPAQLTEADPDVLVVIPCGFSIQRTLQEVNLLLELPGWSDLKAVKNNKVYIADGNHYFNRSGPRLVDSAEILAEILYPKQFAFGYEGNAWIHFNLA